MPQGDFTVGTNVCQQGGIRAAADAAGHKGSGNVAAHKGGHTPGQIYRYVCRTGEIKLPGRESAAKPLFYRKGGGGQGRDIRGGKEMEHGGVAGNDHAVNVADVLLCLPAQLLQQGGYPPADALGQRLPLSAYRPAYPADHVGSKNALGVGGRGRGEKLLTVIKLSGQSGGTDIHCGSQLGKHGIDSKGLLRALDANLTESAACRQADTDVSQYPGAAGETDSLGQLPGGEAFDF